MTILILEKIFGNRTGILMLRTLVYLLFPLLLLTGCYYAFEESVPPFRQPDTYKTEEGIIFKITPVNKIDKHNVSKYLTVFYIDITNNSGNTIQFGSEDIVMIDQFSTQYNALPPDFAANIISENSPARIYPRFSVGFGTGYYSDDFYYWGHHRYPFYRYHPFNYDHYYYPDYYYRSPNVDFVYRNALVPGTVHPGASTGGFVYFKKLPKEVNNVKLLINYSFKGTSTTKEITFDLAR